MLKIFTDYYVFYVPIVVYFPTDYAGLHRLVKLILKPLVLTASTLFYSFWLLLVNECFDVELALV